MQKGTRIVSQGAVVAAAKPRPPSPHGQGQDGMTVEVLPDHDGLRVLIADDDADTADSLAMLLNLWGHEVGLARTGAEALAMVYLIRPDVLLLDVAMPDLDGYRVARAIRDQPSLDGVLLVAITGYADDAHRQLGLKAGFDHYLVKPVEPAVVEALLLTTGVNLATRITSVSGGQAPAIHDRTVHRLFAEFPERVPCVGIFAY